MSDPSIRELQWWRGDPARWTELGFSAAPGSAGTDLHAEARAAVVTQLFGDCSEEDADFLVFLLTQETLMHQSGWAFSECMGLAALLVAERKRLTDVFVLWNAKNANFDTMFGLDSELLFAAGVEATIAFVEASDNPARDGIMRYASGTSLPTDVEVRRRLAALREHHSS